MKDDSPDLEQEAVVTGEGYFGLCPECGKTDGYVSVGCDHWFICEAHRTRWPIGANLFSSYLYETEEEQRQICERLGFFEFREVEPIYPSKKS